MAATLRFAKVHDTAVLAHGDTTPSDSDWTAWVQAYSGYLREGVRELLVVTSGGGPNAAQRKQLTHAINAFDREVAPKLRTAICSSSSLARGIMTAIVWLTRAPLRGFDFNARTEALDYLQTPQPDRADVLAAAEREYQALVKP